MVDRIELLAPAGNLEKLDTALHFGADAVYVAGKNYGLRAFTDNFTDDELIFAANKVHSMGKKIYVTLNIFAHNYDFEVLKDFIFVLVKANIDAVIISDLGIFAFVRKYAPNMEIHISTQANTTNKYAAKQWSELGAKRIVAAREMSLDEIKQMRDYLPKDIEIEAFVHGAMCISYSGRCLLSNFMANRESNHGECAQSCRWEYYLVEKSRGDKMEISEDSRGSYILNSRDMNMIEHIDKLSQAGITSFKIEGRVKSSFYVASVVNAYRRAIDIYTKSPNNYVLPNDVVQDLFKTSHRKFCTGFYFGKEDMQCYETSRPKQDYDFCGLIIDCKEGFVYTQMRNKFSKGDMLEVLSPDGNHNSVIEVEEMYDPDGNLITVADQVQQIVKIKTNIVLRQFDMLRRASIK